MNELKQLIKADLKTRLVHLGLIVDYPPDILESLDDLSECLAITILSKYIRKEEYDKLFEENRALEKDKKDLMAHLDSLRDSLPSVEEIEDILLSKMETDCSCHIHGYGDAAEAIKTLLEEQP